MIVSGLFARSGQMFRLVVADLRRDWAMAVCQVFALAAVLTPLLVLFGLQQGVLGQMLRDLQANPAMREIVPRVTGTNRFDAAWLDAARRRADVAFAVGDARTLAAEVEMVPLARPQAEAVLGVLVPTGPGDPLAATAGEPWASGLDRVVLSFGAARALGAAAGERIQLLVPRRRDGTDETQAHAVTVASILPPDRMAETRRAILVDDRLVLHVQRYRDGFAVPELGWPGAAAETGPQRFERFRLYARTIDDVAPLTAWLRSGGVEPVSRLDEIAPIQALNANLSLILAVISAFAAAGSIVALAATQWSGVERKRRELALLTLIGYGRGWLISLPLAQALLLAALGSALAVGLFAAAAGVINARFPAIGSVASGACRLNPDQLLLAAAITCVLAMGAALLAAARVTRIEPAAALRDT
ncbi:FtsX-like permease family protein [Skermanella pratensis]|uniref:FtsX-like permease family protein n=1 Tax=Skermanella pratensis TaxID=2233999 RepID=UPI0013010CA3|nr:FtsX-like permease family protein [Skermanella pratensis]